MEKAYYRKTQGKSLRIPPDAGNDGTKASETVPAEKLIGRRRRRKILKRCAMIAAAFVLLFAVLWMPYRTLVLLNNKRLATAGNGVPSVDINLIPSAAIGRIEVLKDGHAIDAV